MLDKKEEDMKLVESIVKASNYGIDLEFIPEEFGVRYDRIVNLNTINEDIRKDSDVVFIEPSIIGDGIGFTPYETEVNDGSVRRVIRRDGVHGASWAIVLMWEDGTYKIRLEGNASRIREDIDIIMGHIRRRRTRCDAILTKYYELYPSKCEVDPNGIIRVRGYK